MAALGPLLFPIGAVALLFLLGFKSNAEARKAELKKEEIPPDLVNEIKEAAISRQPEKLEAAADKAEAYGKPATAIVLRDKAQEEKAKQAELPQVTKVEKPGKPVTTIDVEAERRKIDEKIKKLELQAYEKAKKRELDASEKTKKQMLDAETKAEREAIANQYKLERDQRQASYDAQKKLIDNQKKKLDADVKVQIQELKETGVITPVSKKDVPKVTPTPKSTKPVYGASEAALEAKLLKPLDKPIKETIKPGPPLTKEQESFFVETYGKPVDKGGKPVAVTMSDNKALELVDRSKDIFDADELLSISKKLADGGRVAPANVIAKRARDLQAKEAEYAKKPAKPGYDRPIIAQTQARSISTRERPEVVPLHRESTLVRDEPRITSVPTLPNAHEDGFKKFALAMKMYPMNYISPTYSLGGFGFSMKRLEDLGLAKNVKKGEFRGKSAWLGDWAEGNSLKGFSNDAQLQFGTFIKSIDDYYAKIKPDAMKYLGQTYEGEPMSLAGLLGVLQTAGYSGGLKWLSSEDDRKQFPLTTKVYHLTNWKF